MICQEPAMRHDRVTKIVAENLRGRWITRGLAFTLLSPSSVTLFARSVGRSAADAYVLDGQRED